MQEVTNWHTPLPTRFKQLLCGGFRNLTSAPHSRWQPTCIDYADFLPSDAAAAEPQSTYQQRTASTGVSTSPAGSVTVLCSHSTAKSANSHKYEATATQPNVGVPKIPAAARTMPWKRNELAIIRLSNDSIAIGTPFAQRGVLAVFGSGQERRRWYREFVSLNGCGVNSLINIEPV